MNLKNNNTKLKTIKYLTLTVLLGLFLSTTPTRASYSLDVYAAVLSDIYSSNVVRSMFLLSTQRLNLDDLVYNCKLYYPEHVHHFAKNYLNPINYRLLCADYKETNNILPYVFFKYMDTGFDKRIYKNFTPTNLQYVLDKAKSNMVAALTTNALYVFYIDPQKGFLEITDIPLNPALLTTLGTSVEGLCYHVINTGTVINVDFQINNFMRDISRFYNEYIKQKNNPNYIETIINEIIDLYKNLSKVTNTMNLNSLVEQKIQYILTNKKYIKTAMLAIPYTESRLSYTKLSFKDEIFQIIKLKDLHMRIVEFSENHALIIHNIQNDPRQLNELFDILKNLNSDEILKIFIVAMVSSYTLETGSKLLAASGFEPSELDRVFTKVCNDYNINRAGFIALLRRYIALLAEYKEYNTPKVNVYADVPASELLNEKTILEQIVEYYLNPVSGYTRIKNTFITLSSIILISGLVYIVYSLYYVERAALIKNVTAITQKVNQFNTIFEQLGLDNVLAFAFSLIIILLMIFYMLILLYSKYNSKMNAVSK
jgi:hypothetical protein